MSKKLEFQVFKPEKHSVRIRPVGDEFEAYIEEMPTMRAYGKTRSQAWANVVMLTVDRSKEFDHDAPPL